jgi:hypothetical protein
MAEYKIDFKFDLGGEVASLGSAEIGKVRTSKIIALISSVEEDGQGGTKIKQYYVREIDKEKALEGKRSAVMDIELLSQAAVDEKSFVAIKEAQRIAAQRLREMADKEFQRLREEADKTERGELDEIHKLKTK